MEFVIQQKVHHVWFGFLINKILCLNLKHLKLQAQASICIN